MASPPTLYWNYSHCLSIISISLFKLANPQTELLDVCRPSPCGPNSQCRDNNGAAACNCLPNFVGNPPGCRPECVLSSECSWNKACVNQKCVDPCLGACGKNSDCKVKNHSPICSCRNGYTGNPFSVCSPVQRRFLNSIRFNSVFKSEIFVFDLFN